MPCGAVALIALVVAGCLSASPARANDSWLIGSSFDALRTRVFKLPQPVGTAPEEGPLDVNRAAKGDRLTPAVPAPAGPIAVLTLPDADPPTTGSLPPKPPAPTQTAALTPAPAREPRTVIAPVMASAAPLDRPAPGFVPSAPLTGHLPEDLITRGPPGAPGTFPPLVPEAPTIFQADRTRLPPLAFEHLARAPVADAAPTAQPVSKRDLDRLPQDEGPAATMIRRLLSYVSG